MGSDADVNKPESLAERLARRMAESDGDGAAQRALPPASGSGSGQRGITVTVRQPLRIDLAELEAAGFVTPYGRPTPLTQEVRAVKRRLLASTLPSGGARAGIVLVTSPLPREGKTFLSLNLALSLSAERELNVVLVDADSRRRTLGAHFGLAEAPGLTDLLAADGRGLGEVVRRTSLANLSFLPSGSADAQAAELMAAKQMGRVLAGLAAGFRDQRRTMIILDAPPALAGGEATALSLWAARTVVVVKSRETTKRHLARALSLLQGCTDIDCVINMVDAEVCGLVEYG